MRANPIRLGSSFVRRRGNSFSSGGRGSRYGRRRAWCRSLAPRLGLAPDFRPGSLGAPGSNLLLRRHSQLDVRTQLIDIAIDECMGIGIQERQHRLFRRAPEIPMIAHDR
ncbi:hypothetical protein TVNIR_1215 [Thioalkalivibrio nitratireducens DSM 14787]|uniref:Uncharacterized protein n=1 Tax=Thioalkalivibrio nitratireducens (strain DSM 14787 / UNIQEM 213 / ALEN2) TaxID=1255043 RepID=L0DTI0_THIND|nr:hypothetical protein TVNIR_1215 [Thioalkalivibrio nitratireducens DSM 14787]